MKLATKYRGVVLSVQADSFWARLESPGQPDEECEFKLTGVSSEERKLILPGAAFAFVIEQHLHFDPQKTYSAEDMEKARKRAEEWKSVIDSDKEKDGG